MKEYTLGFLFDAGRNVLLIEKQNPPWQRGYWNGIGGKIEDGETPTMGIHREFMEEAGLLGIAWKHFATVSGPNYKLWCFYDIVPCHSHAYSVTAEKVESWPMTDLPKVIPNVRWLIPMALSLKQGEQAYSFQVQESYEKNTAQKKYSAPDQNSSQE